MSDDLLGRLQAAKTDYQKARIITMDLIEFLDSPLRAATRAAAIPHWFDAPILSALLGIPSQKGEYLYLRLQELPFVEPFQNLGHNVHELTRQVILCDWWTTGQDEYRNLSLRASNCFAQSKEARRLVEWTYHLLIADEDRGADALHDLGVSWLNSFLFDLLHSLVQATMEHVEAGRIVNRGRAWALFLKGVLNFRYSNNAQAKTDLEESLACVSPGEQLLLGHLNFNLGRVHDMLSQLKEARGHYEEALSVYREIKDPLGQANAIRGLGDVHVGLSEFKEARERYENALSVYREIGNCLGEAHAISALGDVHLALSEFKKARERYENALSVYREIKDPLGQANAIRGLGEVNVMLSEYEEAREHYENALSVYRKIAERMGQAEASVGLGNIHKAFDEHEEARRWFEEALSLYPSLGSRLGVANASNNLGDVQTSLSEYKAARRNCEKALSIHREIGNQMGVANSLRNLGKLAIVEGRRDEAQGLVSQSLEICRSIGDMYGEACNEVVMALLEVSCRRGIAAAGLLKKASGSLEEMGARRMAEAVRSCLERIDLESGSMGAELHDVLLAVCLRFPTKQTII